MLYDQNRCSSDRVPFVVGVDADEMMRLIAHAAVKIARERPVKGKTNRPSVQGVPAAPGDAIGPAVVIRSRADLQRAEPGCILICSTLSPEYSAAFSTVGGIVSETGGSLSTSATIARENGRPVVTGVRSARTIISDGDVIRINGADGYVRIMGMNVAAQSACD